MTQYGRTCLVCGSVIAAGEGRCGQCDTPTSVLDDIKTARQRPRFLFGRVRMEDVRSEPFSVAPLPPGDAPKPASAPRTRPLKPSAKQAEAPPVRRARAFSDQFQPRDQDPPVEVAAPVRFSVLWDGLITVLLNGVVLLMVLWVSSRSLEGLLQFSLMPLLFVHLTFTGLYYWLFLGLFGRTLGRLVGDWVVDRMRT